VRRAAVVALSAMLAFPVRSRGADDFKFFEEEATVVAATHRSQTVSRAPAVAHVITSQDIERYGYRTLGEALESVPGILVSTDRNYSYMNFRGIARPGDYNSRILVLVDGHRYNENVYGGVYPGADFGVDLRAVDHIEVIKGPGSALYGDSAFLGVVNVVTRSAAGAPSVLLASEGGSFGTSRHFADLSVPVAGGGVYAASSYRYSHGQAFHYPEVSPVAGGLSADSDREENYTGYVKVVSGGWKVHANGNNRSKRIPTGAFGIPLNDPASETFDSRDFAEAQYEHAWGDAVSLTGRAYHDWYVYTADYAYEDPSTTPPTRSINKDLAHGRWYGEEVRLRLGDRNAFTLGQDFEKNLEGRQKNYYEGTPAQLDVDQRLHRWSLFAQQEWEVHPALSLTAGARYDAYQTFGRTVSPRGAVVFRPAPHSTVKALYGGAFRAPTPYERLYQTSSYKTNTDLQPEKARTAELQWEQRLPSLRGSASVSVFHSRLKGLITEEIDPADGMFVFRNRQSIVSRGLEASLRGAWSGGWSGFAGYFLQESQEGGENHLSNSPRHSGTAGLTRAFAPWNASLSARVLLVGARRSFQGTGISGAVVPSVIASAEPWSRGPRLFAAVYNVTDARYETSGSPEHVQTGIRQDGRHYLVGVEQRFGR
jgi:iron complex outermembrane receptor protein